MRLLRTVAGPGARKGRIEATLTLSLLSLATSGCEQLLEVEPNPHTIDASGEVGLDEMMVGAAADLYFAYDSQIVHAGLFGDEFVQSGTAHFNFDTRTVEETASGGGARDRSIGGPFYIPMQKAVAVADIARERLLDGDFAQVTDPVNSPQYARVSTYSGFAKTWLTDMYCTVAFNGVGPELSSAEAYARAERDFTAAIDATRAEPAIRNAAWVGRARVRLLLGKLQEAVADAQRVPPDFELLATYSTNSFEQRNRVHFRTWEFGNWSVDPTMRDLTVDQTGVPDPRVRLAKNPRPAYEPTQQLYTPFKVSTASSPLRIATGDEAQLIIAEVQLGQAAVDILNRLRIRKGITAAWTPLGTGANEIRDKVIDERRRTLFLDGVRLGDLRRYLARYRLDFFPTSTPQGLPMGTQTCMPLPSIERENNPGLSGK